MTIDSVERIERAAAHVNAQGVGDGWAYYAHEVQAWYFVSGGELAKLCDYLDHPDEHIRDSAYSHWCSGSAAAEIPDDRAEDMGLA